jgi:hypothetical protein
MPVYDLIKIVNLLGFKNLIGFVNGRYVLLSPKHSRKSIKQ